MARTKTRKAVVFAARVTREEMRLIRRAAEDNGLDTAAFFRRVFISPIVTAAKADNASVRATLTDKLAKAAA